nr:hypothetical protein [Blastopirellula retiformator]
MKSPYRPETRKSNWCSSRARKKDAVAPGVFLASLDGCFLLVEFDLQSRPPFFEALGAFFGDIGAGDVQAREHEDLGKAFQALVRNLRAVQVQVEQEPVNLRVVDLCDHRIVEVGIAQVETRNAVNSPSRKSTDC